MNRRPLSFLACSLFATSTLLCAVGCQPRAAGVDQGRPRDMDGIGEVDVVVRDQTGADRLDALVGQQIRVQFRRDALGLSATSPVPPTAERSGIRTVYLDGELAAVTAAWIELRTERVTYWIPREGVLLIEVPRAQ